MDIYNIENEKCTQCGELGELTYIDLVSVAHRSFPLTRCGMCGAWQILGGTK